VSTCAVCVAGFHKEAVLALEKALAIRRSTWVLALLGYAHARAEEPRVALEILAELKRT